MWQEQFELRMVKLDHSQGADFSICNWQRGRYVRPLWLVWRFLIFLYYVVTILWMIAVWHTDAVNHDKKMYAVYMSNWSHLVQGFVFGLALIVAVIDFSRERDGAEPEEKVTILKKVFWFFYTMSLPCTILVCVGFWSTVYQKGDKIRASAIILHVTNGVFHVVDFFLVAFPHRFFHFYMPDCLVFLYLIFSVIYELSTDKNQEPIYPLLDWSNHPYKTFTFATLFIIGLYVVHVVFFLFYMMKRIYRMKREGSES